MINRPSNNIKKKKIRRHPKLHGTIHFTMIQSGPNFKKVVKFREYLLSMYIQVIITHWAIKMKTGIYCTSATMFPFL